MFPDLMKNPLSTVLANSYRPFLVQTDPSSVEYRGGQNGVGDGWQALGIKIAWLGFPGVDTARGVNEFLNRNVSISPLAIKMAAFGRRIFHAGGKRAIIIRIRIG
jgi:hypothetical protein